MAGERVPGRQSAGEDLINLVLVKGILSGLILCFARKPAYQETKGLSATDNKLLEPYTPDEAMEIVDKMFARYQKEAEGGKND